MRRCVVVAVIALAACSASDDFPAPQIASINPTHATPGASIVIDGDFFCHQSGEDQQACTTMGAVYFGSLVTTALQYDETQITAEVPMGVGTVDVTITVAGEQSNAISFTFD
jgi:hypothetical protein